MCFSMETYERKTEQILLVPEKSEEFDDFSDYTDRGACIHPESDFGRLDACVRPN